MTPHEKPSTEKELVEFVISNLLDIAKGECSITEDSIISEEDETRGELLSGLLHLHETIDFQKNELKRLVQQEKKLAAAESAAAIEKKNAEELRTQSELLKIKEQELTRKIAEMERTNRLMVGRELAMIELKKKINALLEEQGRPKEYKVE